MYDGPIKQGDNADAPTGYGPILPVLGRDTTTLRQQIFEYVRAAGRAARADVTRALGISAGSATTLTADLIARGMLREVEGLARGGHELPHARRLGRGDGFRVES
mgnify:CR=1 FL=1